MYSTYASIKFNWKLKKATTKKKQEKGNIVV